MRRVTAMLYIAGALAMGLPKSALATPFYEGLTARTYYEQWFEGLTDVQKAGAAFWATERSKPQPKPCGSGSDAWNPVWMESCLEARQRLKPSDARRRVESAYRTGWNSYSAPNAAPTPTNHAAQPSQASANTPAVTRSQNEHANTQQPQEDEPRRYVAGGPFTVSGSSVVACGDSGASMVLNTPNSEQVFGRMTVARATLAGRCDDFPEGLPVLVLGIYGRQEVNYRFALVVPDLPKVVVSVRFVPASHVINVLGDAVDKVPEVDWPRITYKAASHQYR